MDLKQTCPISALASKFRRRNQRKQHRDESHKQQVEQQAEQNTERQSGYFKKFIRGGAYVVSVLIGKPREATEATSNIGHSCRSNPAGVINNAETGTVEALFPAPFADPAADSNSVIVFASENGNTVAVKLLLSDSRVNPAAARDNYAILNASKNGHTVTVKLLLKDSRVKPNAQSNSAIRLACQTGHSETVAMLAADPRVKLTGRQKFDIIRNAIQCGYIDVASILLTHFRMSNEDLQTILIVCVQTNNIAIFSETTTRRTRHEKKGRWVIANHTQVL